MHDDRNRIPLVVPPVGDLVLSQYYRRARPLRPLHFYIEETPVPLAGVVIALAFVGVVKVAEPQFAELFLGPVHRVSLDYVANFATSLQTTRGPLLSAKALGLGLSLRVRQQVGTMIAVSEVDRPLYPRRGLAPAILVRV